MRKEPKPKTKRLLVRRPQLVDAICKLAHITRKTPGAPNFSKKELLQIHTYLTLGNDLQIPKGTMPDSITPPPKG